MDVNAIDIQPGALLVGDCNVVDREVGGELPFDLPD
jgi:hypothetical protein